MKLALISAILSGFLVLFVASRTWADDIRIFGDRVVAQSETVTGDVIAVTGDLVIRGHVTGSVIAYVGNVTLDSSAVVDRDVIAKRGRVYRAAGATISGNVVQGRMPSVRVGREEEQFPKRRLQEDLDASPDDEAEYELTDETDLKLAYTKVDGLYVGLDLNQFPFSDYGARFRTFASGGYAFSSHTWQGRGGFGFGFLPRGQLELSVDAFHLNDTEDSWYMSDTENSLAAFFLHEDFRDYYQREGFGTTLAWKPFTTLEFSARYQADQHQQLENATDWALFGGAKAFRPNLPITAGMLREFVLGGGWDTRDDRKTPSCGWRLETQLELSSPDLASDFDYRRAVLDVRRYQPLGNFINLDSRLRLGNSKGLLPLQKRFYLGGPSSLPGFELKEISGKEFVLGNVEIRLHDDRHHHHGLFDELGLVFFANLGLAADQSLMNFSSRDWSSDVGVGLSTDDGSVRLQVAKRTDRSADAYVWMFRIQRPF